MDNDFSLRMGAAGRESSVCAGANFSPPHSAMRLLFEMCQEVPFCPRGCKRDCVAKTPIVTIRSVTATRRVSPTTAAMKLPRRVFTPSHSKQVVYPCWHLPESFTWADATPTAGRPHRQLQKTPLIDYGQNIIPCWEARPRQRVAWTKTKKSL